MPTRRAAYLLDSLRRRGAWKTGALGLAYLLDGLFDLRHGTDTSAWVELDDLGLDASARQRAVMYQPTQAIPLRNLLRQLGIPPGKKIVDLGCGKGRVLLVASQFGFSEARGVEVSAALCEIARRNCALYARKARTHTRFVIERADAIDYRFHDDEDVLFLFNPFDAYTFGRVMDNLAASLRRRSRDVLILYRHPLHAAVLGDSGFTRTLRFRSWEQEFSIFSNAQRESAGWRQMLT